MKNQTHLSETIKGPLIPALPYAVFDHPGNRGGEVHCMAHIAVMKAMGFTVIGLVPSDQAREALAKLFMTVLGSGAVQS